MPDSKLQKLSRAQLAQLGREYMLASQFNSRTGYAALRINHGEEAYKDIAIANWMGASPVYTKRMQKTMGFDGGEDIATIFKGLQLECGFTHQYFDVHFEVLAEDRGRFWLNSCGPLLETEPRGEEAVRTMCHDIEDPTFDATAVATNPLARMRPVHRPPRKPADRSPHCEWSVYIEHDGTPIEQPAITATMAATALASLAIEVPAPDGNGGMDAYSGAVFEQLQLEQLSHGALVAVCREIAIQNHLLITSMLYAIAQRYGKEAAHAVAEFQMIGSVTAMSHRLSTWLDCAGGGIDAVLEVASLHPAFQPADYHGLEWRKLDDKRAVVELKDCPATRESIAPGWFVLSAEAITAGLQAMVRGVEPRAQVVQADPDMRQWEINIEESVNGEEDPLPVQVAKSTVLYKTTLKDHIPLLHINESS